VRDRRLPRRRFGDVEPDEERVRAELAREFLACLWAAPMPVAAPEMRATLPLSLDDEVCGEVIASLLPQGR
jgi:hypothetical protein